ncbi:hypothetical protein BDR07DRAFT_1377515 [Suillus spraguei]|nr:hypothetical protein BDR07DRAFT_1377515 [Suillus spraguei]
MSAALRHDRLYKFNASPPQDSHPDTPQAVHSSTHELSLEPPTKRPRYDTASISNLIPQPHYVPGPSVGFPPLDSEYLKPYRKAQPLPIAPFDLASAQLFLNAFYNRAAWLIPIRGVLPWEDATCAIILAPPQVPQGDDTPPLPPDLQHYTTESQEFLGLIIRFAPSDTTSTLNSALSLTAGSGNRPAQAGRSANLSDGLSDRVRHAQLEDTDFIKVYHDTKYSFYLRNILDAYKYIPGETPSEGRHPADREIDGEIRLLKLARLVYIAYRYVLVCRGLAGDNAFNRDVLIVLSNDTCHQRLPRAVSVLHILIRDSLPSDLRRTLPFNTKDVYFIGAIIL